MRFKRWMIAIPLVCLFAYLLTKGWSAYTKEQRRQKRLSAKMILPAKAMSKLNKAMRPSEEIDAMLAQPYFYAGKGRQCIAFESADGQYILKFPKQKRRANSEKAKRQEESCLLAAKFPEETALLYVHLGTTSDHRTVQLLDKRGHLVEIALDKVQFYLQEKARFLKPLIIRLMHQGDIGGAKERISQLFDVLVRLAQGGIIDRDGALIRNNNVAFLANRAVIIDFGKFTEMKKPLSREAFRHELRRLQPFSKWLQKNYSVLATHFDECRVAAIQHFS
jgi:hypothetical protein